jgi:hypothetical protein
MGHMGICQGRIYRRNFGVAVVDDILYAIEGGLNEQNLPIGYGAVPASPEPSSEPELSKPYLNCIIGATLAITI